MVFTVLYVLRRLPVGFVIFVNFLIDWMDSKKAFYFPFLTLSIMTKWCITKSEYDMYMYDRLLCYWWKFSCAQTIHRDISGYSPDHGSLHIDTFDASISGSIPASWEHFLREYVLLSSFSEALFIYLADRYFCPSTPSRWW